MKSVRFAPSFYLKARCLRNRGLVVNKLVSDVGGSIVDKYTTSVSDNIQWAVKKEVPFLLLTDREIRSFMGSKKMDHLKQLFQLPSVVKRTAGFKPNLQKIHDSLEKSQIEYYEKHPESTELLPGVYETLDLMKSQNPNMQISLTTGFPRSILDCVLRNRKSVV